MTVTAMAYARAAFNAFKALIDLDNAVIKVAFLDDTYVYDGTHDSYDDIAPFELPEGGGYFTGGIELLNHTLTMDNDEVVFGGFPAPSVEIANSTLTGARFAVVYDAVPALSTDKKVITWIDFGVNRSTNNEPFKITWPGGVIFKVVAPPPVVP